MPLDARRLLAASSRSADAARRSRCSSSFALIWFCNLDYRASGASRRRPLRRDPARDGGERRLGDAAAERHQVFREAALQYWITAAAYEAFGVHEWTARLWPALAGFLGVLFIGYVGVPSRRADARPVQRSGARRVASGLRAQCAHPHARRGLDALDDASGSAAFFSRSARRRTPRETRVLDVGGLGGAGARDAVEGTDRHRAARRRARPLLADRARLGAVAAAASGLRRAALFLAIAAPWFVVVSLRNPEFFDFFFIHEHFTRFLTNEHQREGAWWYFIPIFVARASCPG